MADEQFTPSINRRTLLTAAGAVGVLPLIESSNTARGAGLSQAAAAPASLFARFVGTCQAGGSPGDVYNLQGIHWDRQDFSWQSFEPTPGQFNADYLTSWRNRISHGRSNGVTVLPVLAYTAPWAARTTAYEFDHDGDHYEIGPVLSQTDTHFTRRVVVTNASGDVISDSNRSLRKDKTPPASAGDWEAFVDRVVAALRADPYNVEYFQIWNEAYPMGTFWKSGMDDYMEAIHLPAAGRIRARGGKVVYGGWPSVAWPPGLASLLTTHNAWATIDVLDMHYQAISSFPDVYAAAVENMGTRAALWETESGYSTNAVSIPNVYVRVFYWALGVGLVDVPDRVKMFWFAWHSPNDPAAPGYRKCLRLGASTSDHGRALSTLLGLLTGHAPTRYTNFSMTPSVSANLNGAASSREAFHLESGDVVFAIHLANSADISSVTITAPALSSRQAQRVDIFGGTSALSFTPGTDELQIPAHDPNPEAEAANSSTGVRTFYARIS